VSDFDLVLSGTVVLPDQVVEAGFVAVSGSKIAMVGRGTPPQARERHTLGRALILPGAIDSHVHSLSRKNQEDFQWSTRSAAAGGVTTIVDMPYDDGNLVASTQAVKDKREHAEARARVDFALFGTVNPDDGAKNIPAMIESGVAALKFSTFGTHPTRFPRIPPATLADCFATIAPFGLVAGVHNEDHESVDAYMARTRASGITDWRAHGLSRPPLTELLAMHQIYEIGAATGCVAHVVHCSLSRGYEIAASYRAQGYAATAEACIHYLVLDEENDVRRLVGKAKINAPIRSRAEVEGLWRQVAAGNVGLVSSDHVSWSEDRKLDPDMLANASGAPGLEAMVSLFIAGCLARGLSLTWAARLMVEHPARHFRINDTKGALTPGCDADITVMLPEPRVYNAAASGHNVVSWGPYDGISYLCESARLICAVSSRLTERTFWPGRARAALYARP
jgi:allantoinase